MPKVEKVAKKEYRKVIVEGIAMFPHIHRPARPYNSKDIPQYQLDLVVSDEEAKKVLDEGLKAAKTFIDEDTKKPKEYKEYPGLKVFQFRRRTEYKDKATGEMIKNSPLVVTDSQTNLIPSNILIGNGSKVRVMINPYQYEFEGKKGTTHTLLEVQVLELVPYENKAGSGLDPVKGGFIVSNTPAHTQQHESVEMNEEPFSDD